MSNVTASVIEIVDKATGHVSVMHFVTEERDGATELVRWSREATAENIERELVRSQKVLADVTWRLIAPRDIPTDRTFRNSWRSDGSKIAVDMPIARIEHMARMRRARDAALVVKDGEWMKEFSRGNQAKADAIEAERQTLRDIPQAVDADIKAAATPESLKAVWPAELGPR